MGGAAADRGAGPQRPPEAGLHPGGHHPAVAAARRWTYAAAMSSSSPAPASWWTPTTWSPQRPREGPRAMGHDVPEVLRIEVSGRVGSGHFIARPPLRTFWQWLTRQPRP